MGIDVEFHLRAIIRIYILLTKSLLGSAWFTDRQFTEKMVH